MRSETWQFYLTAITWLSFCSAVLVVLLIVRSFWEIDMFVHYEPTSPPVGKSWSVFTNRGWIRYGYQEDDVPKTEGTQYTRHPTQPWTGHTKPWEHLGFGYDSARNYRSGPYTIHYRAVTCPLWFFAVLLFALPATEVYRWWRQRRHKKTISEG